MKATEKEFEVPVVQTSTLNDSLHCFGPSETLETIVRCERSPQVIAPQIITVFIAEWLRALPGHKVTSEEEFNQQGVPW